MKILIQIAFLLVAVLALIQLYCMNRSLDDMRDYVKVWDASITE